MAETGTRPEIEDVLASIRRLVSQDSPRQAESYPAPRRPQPPEPLVLTPAQLVSENPEAEEAPEVSLDTPEAEEIAAPALSDARRAPQNFEPDFDDADDAWPTKEDLAQESLGEELARLEDTLAHLEAEVSRDGIDYEPEQGDRFELVGVPPLTDLPEEFDAAALGGAEDALIEDAAMGTPVDDLSDADVAFAQAPDAASVELPPLILSSDAAETAAELDENAPEPVESEAGVDPDLMDADWAQMPEEPQDVASVATEDASTPSLEWEDRWPHEAAPPRRLHLSDAEARAPEPELRASSYEDLRDSMAEDQDEPDLEALEAELAEIADEPEAPLHPAAMSLDEGQLRQLVSAMLREELQGALGSRITRNLRKLIRREVQRALMSRDLD
ncbi:hypothetical protein [Thioclava pacifica]|uniref:Uncharacterized protein n=1 Tax=Thioclava pacifica DSM 10166 TaxID=1353537 RepID=A0A074J4A8_9RHOB|nr:hypothetical protein [Thioclava pacifica]KEO50745.1 hypothetical protein TP2_14040 [Thioclava pacifica DSM 10166]